jgi:two-component system response regulator FlrC
MAYDVLVVDDDPLVRQTLTGLIRQQGYDAMAVASGEEALEHLVRAPGRLVLADVRLPWMHGLDLLRQVRRLHPHVPVVLISGHGSVEMAVKAIQAGAEDFLMKPFQSARLAEILARILGLKGGGAGGSRTSLAGIVSQDPRMIAILEAAVRVAQSPAPVLIQGESGTGKELIAREIHLASPRRDKPFVALNCAALPESLLESELFGHERGAFTGAVAQRMGRFQAAHQGTLLLDEVSETSLQLQAKLLRALQEGEVDRVGRDRPVRVDVRVLATTNRCLREALHAGRFRQDLFFRLNVFSLSLPPLRERPDDIPHLARHFVEKHRAACASPVREIGEAALRQLKGYPWPGNVRELESCIQRALLLCPETVLQPSHINLESGLALAPANAGGTRADMERRLILATLDRVGGNRTRAAEALGISVRTIRNRLRQYREEVGAPVAASLA